MTGHAVEPAPLHYREFDGGHLPASAFAFMFRFLWLRYRGRVLLLTLTAAGGIGTMSLEPLFIRDLVDALKAGESGGAVWWPFALLAGAWVVSAVFNRLRDIVDLYTAPVLRYEAQTCLFSYLIEHAPQYFHDNFAGRLAQKVKQVGQALLSLLSIIFNEMTRLVVAILMALIIVVPQGPSFALLLLGWMLLYLPVVAFLARRCIHLSKAFSDEVSASTGVIADVVGNAEVVRSFARGPYECLRVARSVAAEHDASVRLRWYLVWMWLVLYTGLLVFQIAFLGLAVHEALAGRMSIGETVMVFSLSVILTINIWGLSVRMLEFFEQIGVLQSALDTVVQPHAVVEAPDARPLQVRGGGIELRGVRFRHGNGTAVFDGLDLAIAPGEKVALVGPSGSGKSTLVGLIRRQFDPQAGQVLIDGQDIAGVTLDSLHRAIAEVPQSPGLFHRSLSDNIRYAELDADDGAMLAAAAKAHCDAFVQARPEGYEALVGERGIQLSGGERQRVAIARALLKDAPILILDEATSALDSETEHAIQTAMAELFRDRTVIAIAHRLSTIRSVDRIVYLEQGRIVEAGRHADLLARNGRYARLWQRQAYGFVDAPTAEYDPAITPTP